MTKTVAQRAQRRCTYGIMVGKHEEKRHLENTGVDGRIILKLVFKKRCKDTDWIDLIQQRYW
jgi:hypothetical protein